jgi:hypothetical protein
LTSTLLYLVDQGSTIRFELRNAYVALVQLRLQLALCRLGRSNCFLSLGELIFELSPLLLKGDLGETFRVLGAACRTGRRVGRGKSGGNIVTFNSRRRLC